jgi:hypothetical protein
VWGAGQYRVVAGSQVPATATNPPWLAGGSQMPSNLIWIDLGTSAAPSFDSNGTPVQAIGSPSATAQFYANRGITYGFISRTGDPNPSASCPSWSHDGTKIVYVSNNAAQDGRLATGKADLYVVPYSGGAGGVALPLSGAATTTMNEYYPAYSPDDAFVAYTAVPSGDSMYYDHLAEIYAVPAGGGTAERLRANDPPACTATASPGVTNSWPRWSPDHATCANGKTYYWVVFSSTRQNVPYTVDAAKRNFKTGVPGGPTSQLYVAGVIADASGAIQSFPANYVWSQSTQTSDGFAQSNHTPDWQIANIP